MKDIPNIHLELPNTGSEVIIRQGDALPAKAKRSILISGVLGAPDQFLTGKEFDAEVCHIRVFQAEGKIELHVHDTDPYCEHVITGALKRDSVLDEFAINTDHRWTIAEFLKFIKTMKYYFADKAANAKLVESLQKWSVKIERVINEHNDNKGNSNYQLETKVHQSATGQDGLISKFDLLIPIFQGYDKMKFTVEIGLDPKNTSVMLYLISDDLIELEIGQREKLIADELKKLEDFTCSKIFVS